MSLIERLAIVDIGRFPNPADITALGRMTIEHNTARLLLNESELTPFQMSNLILLGAVRQRIMYAPREEGGALECRSNDFEKGQPTRAFPVGDANFPKYAIEGAQTEPNEYLACGACVFKEWKADPARGMRSIKPRCVVQIAVPMLIPTSDSANASFVLGSQVFTRSGEKPVTEYMRTFTKNNRPAYTSLTRMRLDVNVGGGSGGAGFRYSVPKFFEGVRTPEEVYPLLSLLYRTAKGIIMSPPPMPTARPATGGGMLSVPVESGPATGTYTGGFFS